MGQNKIILCDTDVVIEFYKGNPDIISELKTIGQENIAVSIITAGELMYGALNKKELNQIKKDLKDLTVYDVDKKTTGQSSANIPSALVHNLVLYTLNLKDYKFIDKLILYK